MKRHSPDKGESQKDHETERTTRSKVWAGRDAEKGSSSNSHNSGNNDSSKPLEKVPACEQIARLLDLCNAPKPEVPQPLLRRTASLSGDIETAARSLLPENTPALYERKWINGRDTGRGDGVLLKFMQFNVLADGLSGEDPEKGGFDAVPALSLDWQFRRINLLREIFRQGVWPDIISMEEVDHYEDWFRPFLSALGYSGSFVAKPSSPCKQTAPHSGLEDGCALFWRNDTVELKQLETMNYHHRDPVDGKPADRKSNQVAILATLKVQGAQPVVAAVTHLVAEKTSEGERRRAQQMSELIERLGALALPCIVGLGLARCCHLIPFPCPARSIQGSSCPLLR